MKKTLNKIQWIIIFYGLALGFSLLQTMLDTSKLLVIFIISPAPFFILIWLSLIKHNSNKAYGLQREKIDGLHIELANSNSEIADLYEQLNAVEVPVKTARPGTPLISCVCPECNKPMTRQTDKIAFCDNLICNRKQWRKDKL